MGGALLDVGHSVFKHPQAGRLAVESSSAVTCPVGMMRGGGGAFGVRHKPEHKATRIAKPGNIAC